MITVACRSATWAQELDMLAAQTLEKLRASLPEGVSVEGLRFRAETTWSSLSLFVICRDFVPI